MTRANVVARASQHRPKGKEDKNYRAFMVRSFRIRALITYLHVGPLGLQTRSQGKIRSCRCPVLQFTGWITHRWIVRKAATCVPRITRPYQDSDAMPIIVERTKVPSAALHMLHERCSRTCNTALSPPSSARLRLVCISCTLVLAHRDMSVSSSTR